MTDVSKGHSSISFSEQALAHLLANLAKDTNNKGIRLSVKKTGCSGLAYVVDYVIAPSDEDLLEQLAPGYILCVDKKSLPFLKGMSVDYVKQGFNAKLVFKNPNQTGQCGCGESFTVDVLSE